MQPDGDDLKKKNIGASLNTIDRKEFHWMIEGLYPNFVLAIFLRDMFYIFRIQIIII